jgi:hypothetical protein
MILAAAVFLGLAASLLRHGRHTFARIAATPLRSAWLVLLAAALQWPLLRTAQGSVPELRVQQVCFLLSYGLLLAFLWGNRWLGSILLVAAGILSNLGVILANGGLMPITPETLVRINPGSQVEQWPTASHYRYSKDVILAKDSTRLWELSDRLVVPPPFPRPTAFSAGDVIVAMGIVAFLLAPNWTPYRRIRHET